MNEEEKLQKCSEKIIGIVEELIEKVENNNHNSATPFAYSIAFASNIISELEKGLK